MEIEMDKPIPKPRRLANDPPKAQQYENVLIDTVNKKLKINDENIEINTISKQLDEKEIISKDQCKNKNEKNLAKSSENNYHKQNEKTSPLPAIRPIPAPRRNLHAENQTNELYENTNIQKFRIRAEEIMEKYSTVARKAPEIPKKSPEKLLEIAQNKEAAQKSPDIKVFQNSRRIRSESLGDSKDYRFDGSFRLKKTASNSTIGSSVSSASSNDNQKYKSPSPSDLLKSLGTTSRLLSESITERVATKAKGAKHKIDKNIKNSQNLLSNWGTETTSRLKSARKKISALGINNLSLSRQDQHRKNTEQDEDRPKTLPANDEVFQSISFYSPLNKASNVCDLSATEHSYEIPRTIKPAHSPLPSYDEAVRAGCSSSFERNTSKTKSVASPIAGTHLIPKLDNRNKSDTNLNDLTKFESNRNMRTSDYNNLNSSDEESLPMPKYPPPILKHEHIYGIVKPIEPPVRPKRRKNYESIEIRKNDEPPAPISNRATVDSVEFREEIDRESRDISKEIKKIVKEQEKRTPNPARSDSWTYYEGNDDDSSSPEPIYANQETTEITYGKLCEMESKDNDIPLTPQVKISENIFLSPPNSPSIQNEPKEIRIVPEILSEFDPLSGTSLNEFSEEKSNQLLLLEHLLLEDAYGAILEDNSILDEQSLISSDEENGNAAAALPIPPRRLDSLPQGENELQIPNQNISLSGNNIAPLSPTRRADSAIDETIVQKYLAKIDETPRDDGDVDLSRPSQSRTNWFVNESMVNESKSIKLSNISPVTTTEKVTKKPFPKTTNDLTDPPSYTEAMSGMTNSFTFSEATSPPSPNATSKDSQSRGSVKSIFSNVFNKMDVLKRKTSFRSSRPAETRIILEMIPKPTLSQRLVRHEGPLIRFPSGVVEDILKEMQNRRAVLRDRKFQTYQDQEMKNQKECFPLEYITTIQCVSNNKTDSSTHLYCFEITTALPKNQSSQQGLTNPNMVITNSNSGNCKLQRVCHLYGVGKESERDIWMQKLIESLTNVFPSNYTCQYYRAGWCYLKNSITSQWSGTWVLLNKRKRRLIFHSDAEMNLEKMDLRKARCIVLKEADDSIKNLHVESGPVIMVDCPPYTIYLIMSSPRETKIWRHIIREVAHNNGPLLHEQQLTKFSVPVIVDKCINFIYIHGSMSEGIYRKSGSENNIQKLLTQFRTDAFNVEITRNEYNEHDVANALKRFMRDLPQKLFGKHSVSFMFVTELKSATERISCYKDLLGRMSEIEYQTLKKIIGHLAFIQSQKSKNRMGIDNLSMIWGPTLLQSTCLDEVATYSQKEGDVIAQLISLYKNLFPLTTDEIKKEQDMLKCLRKYYAAAENLSDSIKKSGDLKVWVTIDINSQTEEKKQENVTLTPTKTAYEICRELEAKVKVPVHQLTLHEVILNESLDRPLHHNEKLFDVVLRWSYWPEADRKNNHLVLKNLDVLKEVQRALKNLATVTPGKELKFADNKTKTFKSLHVELRDGRIFVSRKEKTGTVLMHEICLRNFTAYLGCEKKRDFRWNWAITFIDKESKTVLRSRDLPFIGHVIGGNIWEDRIIWFSTIWNSIYGDEILPPPEIIIK